MTNPASTPADDDDNKGKQKHPKRGRDIQPLHEDALKKQMQNDSELSRTNSDVLAELAEKTAELAGQVKGPSSPLERVLTLDDPEDADPKDIFAALDEIQKSDKDNGVESGESSPVTADPAVNLIREKLNKIYGKEPDATEEATEAVASEQNRSKHQEFMYKLTTSGKALADIQTEWHNYYVDLPNEEKHAVWQEFYKKQHATSNYAQKTHLPEPQKSPTANRSKRLKTRNIPLPGGSSISTKELKDQIIHKVTAGGQLRPIHHIKSALFGIGLAGVVTLIVGFIFFNQVFIAPFISPSKTVSATPIIGNSETEIGPESKIIIPKINLEVPIVYDLGSVEERVIQNALEDGVVHYAASPESGEIGNSVIVGHSSNNILNSGKYKFAFVLLKRLEPEDTFFVHKDGVRYTYKVFDKKIVPPTDTSVLGPSSRSNTITLITCDPPGTSINRLIVVAEQISPDPSGNKEAEVEVEQTTPEELPSNAQSFWSRIISIF